MNFTRRRRLALVAATLVLSCSRGGDAPRLATARGPTSAIVVPSAPVLGDEFALFPSVYSPPQADPAGAGANAQRNAALAFVPESGLDFVVWEDDRGGDVDVYAAALGYTERGHGYGESGQVRPSVAMTPGRPRALVAWEDRRSGDGDIRAMQYHFQAAGPVATTPVDLGAGPGDQVAPKVAAISGGNLVVWEDASGAGDVYGAVVGPDGDVVVPAFPIAAGPAREGAPAVASDGTDAVVAWEDGRPDAPGIYAARIGWAGVVLDPGGFPVATGAEPRRAPAVARAGATYLVAFERGDAAASDVAARRLSPSGVVLDASDLLVSIAPGAQRALAATGDRYDFVLAWEDDRGGDGVHVFGAIIAEDGTVVAPDLPLSPGTGDERAPALAADGRGSVLVAYQRFVADPGMLAVRLLARTLTTWEPARVTLRVGGAPGEVSFGTGGSVCGVGGPYESGCPIDARRGDAMTLTATPAPGSVFLGWEVRQGDGLLLPLDGVCSATGVSCEIRLDMPDTEVTARFAYAPNPLTVTLAGPGIGHVWGDDGAQQVIDCGPTCSASIPSDHSVTLYPQPEPPFRFWGWSGDCAGRDVPCTVSMDAARNVTALFDREPSGLKVAIDGSGRVTSTPSGIDCSFVECYGEFPLGSFAALGAEPAWGWAFGGWSGVCTGTDRTCKVELTAPEGAWPPPEARASFVPSAHVVVRGDTFFGTVTSTAAPCAGHAYGSLCELDALPGTTVELVAHPAPGWAVDRWSGACTGGGTRCSFSTESTGVYEVEVFFVPAVPVEVQVFGPGTVSSPQAEFTCTPDETAPPEWPSSRCIADFPSDRPAEIHAVPEPGFRLQHWEGPCQPDSATCVFAPLGSTWMAAYFEPTPPPATVQVVVTGRGTVTSPQGTFTCALDEAAPVQPSMVCTAALPGDRPAELDAVAGEGYVFSGWNGFCGGTDPRCTTPWLPAGATIRIDATFKPVRYVLDLTVDGSNGSVTSDDGLSCTSSCLAEYPAGTVVTLHAAATGAYTRFSGWSGACSGTDPTCTVTLDAARTVKASFVQTHWPVGMGRSGAGTVTSSPAGITNDQPQYWFPAGTVVTLTATPTPGGRFIGWTGDCSGASPTCAVVADQYRFAKATFDPDYVQLTVPVNLAGAGRVVSSPPGVDTTGTPGSAYTYAFKIGTVVTLTATPSPGYIFDNWSGGACTGTDPVCTFTMSSDRGTTAYFLPAKTATVNLTGTGSGSVTSSPAGIACGAGGACGQAYTSGTSVTLTAAPASGSTFKGWSGACTGTSPTCVLSLTTDQSASAQFDLLPTSALTVTLSGTGSGSVTSSPAGIACGAGGACSQAYASGTSVTLTAASSSSSTFNGWSGACTGTSPTCVLSLTTDQSATAQFDLLPTSALTVTLSGTGAGTVSGGGIDCSASGAPGCAASVVTGSSVTLTATPAAGSLFRSFIGCTTVSGTSCTFTVTAAKYVTVKFEPTTYPLTVSFSGTGAGNVSGGGIDCSASGQPGCTAAVPNGDSVTLTATPAAGSLFRSFTGCTTASGSTCTVTATAAKYVTVKFEPTTYPLTVSFSGTGAGNVSGGGIDCSASGQPGCTAAVPNGDSVTLTATPAAGSLFRSFTGCTTVSGSTCTVTATAAKSVTARFEPSTYPLTVSFSGTGAGNVSGGGIDCSASGQPGCTAAVPNGDSVTLTATPVAGSLFRSFTGCTSVSGSTCTVTATTAKYVTVKFEPSTYSLTVSFSGTGAGSVSGGGIDCSASGQPGCTAAVPNGDSVTLTATPAPGSLFRSFTGCTTVSGSTCTVTATAAKSVTAKFEPSTYPLTVSFSGTGAGNVSGGGIDCSTSGQPGCTAAMANGSSVSLTALPTGASTFGGWSGGGCSGTGGCTVAMTGVKYVTAVFRLP